MLMKQNSYFSRYLRSFSPFCSIVKMDMGCYASTHEHMREDIRIVLRERVHTGHFCHCIRERRVYYFLGLFKDLGQKLFSTASPNWFFGLAVCVGVHYSQLIQSYFSITQ